MEMAGEDWPAAGRQVLGDRDAGECPDVGGQGVLLGGLQTPTRTQEALGLRVTGGRFLRL